MRTCLLAFALSCVPVAVAAQPAPGPTDPPVEPPPAAPPAPGTTTEPVAAPVAAPEPAKQAKKPWYERFKFRGYLQARFNRVYATEDAFENDLADKAIADGNSFSLRRARLVFSGDPTSFLSIYTQAEFAGADAKMRDWYGDVYIDPAKEFRIRIGQSKVPYGFENLQSSSARAPLDRTDAINSGVAGERDIGAVAYWTPRAARDQLEKVAGTLKGSGDYGVVGLGIFNGQGINADDKDGVPYVVARVSYPLAIGGQIIEPGLQGYYNSFTVAKEDGILGGDEIRDMRVAATVVVYPRPIGFQAEYNVGKGPELVGDTIQAENLHGGYAMVLARVGDFVPFARGAYYDGGIKTIENAPHHESWELVVGTEWHIKDRVELTAEVDHAKRTVADATVWGTIVRLQAQVSY